MSRIALAVTCTADCAAVVCNGSFQEHEGGGSKPHFTYASLSSDKSWIRMFTWSYARQKPQSIHPHPPLHDSHLHATCLTLPHRSMNTWLMSGSNGAECWVERVRLKYEQQRAVLVCIVTVLIDAIQCHSTFDHREASRSREGR